MTLSHFLIIQPLGRLTLTHSHWELGHLIVDGRLWSSPYSLHVKLLKTAFYSIMLLHNSLQLHTLWKTVISQLSFWTPGMHSALSSSTDQTQNHKIKSQNASSWKGPIKINDTNHKAVSRWLRNTLLTHTVRFRTASAPSVQNHAHSSPMTLAFCFAWWLPVLAASTRQAFSQPLSSRRWELWCCSCRLRLHATEIRKNTVTAQWLFS